MAQPRARALVASLRLLQRAVGGAALGQARVGGGTATAPAASAAAERIAALAHARPFHLLAASRGRHSPSGTAAALASAANTAASRRSFASSPSSASSVPAAADTAPSNASSADHRQDGVTLSDAAVARLVQLGRDSGGQRVALRIEVEGGGCSGFQYVLRLEEGAKADPSPGDAVFERGGARVLVDEVSLGLLKGSVVDYEDTLMRSAFHVASNPNSESSCGCGSSFTAKM